MGGEPHTPQPPDQHQDTKPLTLVGSMHLAHTSALQGVLFYLARDKLGVVFPGLEGLGVV